MRSWANFLSMKFASTVVRHEAKNTQNYNILGENNSVTCMEKRQRQMTDSYQ